jgi:signal transduction histidine kinase
MPIDRQRKVSRLGLSISRKAVKANGGEVHTHNVPGKGCIFDIELPLVPALSSAEQRANT